MRTIASVALLAVALAGSPAPVWAQAGQRSPGWYVIPSLSLTEEFDDNIFGLSSGKRSDFITRISPGVTFGYQSAPLTLLGSYSFGAEVYADNSELNGVNRHRAGLDFRYLPDERLTLALTAAYNRSETTTGLLQPSVVTPPGVAGTAAPAPTPAPGATGPAAQPGITGVETGRQKTDQYVVSPSVAYAFDPLNSGEAVYTFRRSEVSEGATDNEHEVRLSFARQLTPRDRGSVSYIVRYFESEGADSTLVNGDDSLVSHTVTAGYSRRLTEQTDVSVEAGPRVSDEGDVDAEARVGLTHRFRVLTVSLGYVRSQEIVTGRSGSQTVDTVLASVFWQVLRNLDAYLSPAVRFISADDEAGRSRDTTVYGVAATAVYRITEWLSARAVYSFTLQDERNGDDIRRHVLSVSLDFAYPIRVY